ncbi:MAG: hypothetical protein ACTSUV_06445, partial [Candidatus Ranarchaeia archaeon]
PIIGEWTKPLLMIAITLISNPLIDTWTLLSWVLPVSVGALLAGGDWKRGMAIASSVISINFTILGLAAVQVLGVIQADGIASIMPPPGFDITLLLTTPLGQSLAGLITSFFGSGSGGDPTAMLGEVAQSLGTNVTINLFICTLTGALVGQLAGMMGISPKNKDKKKKNEVVITESEGVYSSQSIKLPFKFSKRKLFPIVLSVFFLGILLGGFASRPAMVTAAPVSVNSDGGFSIGDFPDLSNLHIETLQYIITDSGDAIAAGLYVPVPIPGLNYSDPMWASEEEFTGDLGNYSGLLAMVLMSTSNVYEVFNIILGMTGAEMPNDTGGLPISIEDAFGLIPEKGLFFIYLNEPEAATKAGSILTFLESSVGVEIAGDLTVISIAIEEVTITLCVGTISTEEQVLVEAFIDLIGNDSLNPWNWDILSDADAYVMILGGGPFLGQFLNIHGVVLGIGAYWEAKLTGAGSHTFSIKDLTPFTGNISMRSTSNFSLMMMHLPEEANVTDYYPPMTQYNATEQEPLTLFFNQTAGFTSVDDFNVTFNYNFPPKIVVTRFFSEYPTTADQPVNITLVVSNQDNVTVTNVKLQDGGILNDYTTVQLVSGNPNGTWTSIAPGENKTLTYSVTFESEGVYTFPRAPFFYDWNSTTYSRSVSITTMTVIGNPTAMALELMNDYSPWSYIIVLSIVLLPPIQSVLKRSGKSS